MFNVSSEYSFKVVRKVLNTEIPYTGCFITGENIPTALATCENDQSKLFAISHIVMHMIHILKKTSSIARKEILVN